MKDFPRQYVMYFEDAVRERLETGFLRLKSIWLLRGEELNKNLLSKKSKIVSKSDQ